MALFILPTSGPRTYRGKYPTRVRSVSCGATGLHLELNDGTRLWSYGSGGNFPALRPGFDFGPYVDSAFVMTAEQYATLREAAEVRREPLASSSPADKARERDAKAGTVRRLLESIIPADCFRLVNRMGRVDVWEGEAVANGGTAWGFDSEGAARAWLVEYCANRAAGPVDPDNLPPAPEVTERLPAPATLSGKADGGPEVTERLSAPAPVRRDNVEYHAGRNAFAAGEARDACPYPSGGERAGRWNLGWREAWAEANPARATRLAQAEGMAEIAKAEQREAIAERVAALDIILSALETGTYGPEAETISKESEA